MTKRQLFFLSFAEIFVALLLITPQARAGEAIVVIVNAANPVDSMSLGELKKVFLSERSRWDTGKSVAPVVLASGQPARVTFLKVVCGMTDSDFAKYFVQAAFTGKVVSPPKEVSSARDLKSVVAGSPGAIGFVKASDLQGGDADGPIKQIKVDGSAASDANYKIKM